MSEIRENPAWKMNGFIMLLLLILDAAFAVYIGFQGIEENIVLFVTLVILFILIANGFKIVQPKQKVVLTFFGKYVGSVVEDGFHWVNPFTLGTKISCRVRNFDSDTLKVNDFDGNPIEIGAVVVWRVVDSAKAVLEIENVEEFVDIQSETAIRSIATRYPYDSHGELPSLKGNPNDVANALQTELAELLSIAGVEILEARISHLAYAPEIAQAMLRRQQAQAVVAARKKIVEGAMGMVSEVLQNLEKEGVINLDEERKAAMANNLLVALVSENGASPVINTGSLYT